MIYEFIIPKNPEEIEDFELSGNNFCLLKVFDRQGIDISKEVKYVTIFLSKNAMLGFGTELIRLAHNFEERKKISIIPASKEKGAQQSMGIFLTPDSCELVIECKNFESLEKYIEEYKKTINRQ